MYAHFKGTIDSKFSDRIILDVNDIGYEIYMPESEILSLEDNKNKVKIYTYLNVREDDMKLFGFTSLETLEFFKKLISVSGGGPKVALGIISNVNVSDMCVAIATDNIATLKSIPGIGPKMAQKIIFELKDKVIKDQMIDISEKKLIKNTINPNESEAITALQVLGYNKREIEKAFDKLAKEDMSTEELIRKGLTILGK